MRTAALFLAVALASACHSAQPAKVAAARPNPAVLSDVDGLLTMRMFLSAQMTSHGRAKAYLPIADALRDVEIVANPATPVSQLDAETVGFKGYRLRMTVADDKRRFQASLTPEKGCGRSWFSNDTGLIFVGQALGCASN